MTSRTVKLAGVGLVAAASLGGCATTARPTQYSYYRVACDTPGAFRAEAVEPAATERSAPANTPDQLTTIAAAPVCLVAVSSRRYRPGYYGPGYASFGLGFGFGHHGGGHHGGGHHGGGHGRGH